MSAKRETVVGQHRDAVLTNVSWFVLLDVEWGGKGESRYEILNLSDMDLRKYSHRVS